MSKDQPITLTGRLSPDLTTLVIDYGHRLKRMLKPLAEDVLEITIKKHYRKRTVAQNNWIWGVCIPTIRAWKKEIEGIAPSPEAIYTFLRQHIVEEDIIIEEIDGKEIFYFNGKRFSQCTTIEFSERVEKIILYYAERDLEIPLPQPKTNNVITDFVKDE
jgi:hypothetical protein